MIPPACRAAVIGQDAFWGCSSLSSVRLPGQLQIIRPRAFYRCKELKTVHFPPSLKQIGNYAFYFCGIDSLELPDSLEYIGEAAFFKCNHLVSVTLPPSVRRIEKWVFHGCNRLKYLEIRHDPEYIGEWIINKAATIRCYKGSRVDRYCQESGFHTEYLEEPKSFSIW